MIKLGNNGLAIFEFNASAMRILHRLESGIVIARSAYKQLENGN